MGFDFFIFPSPFFYFYFFDILRYQTALRLLRSGVTVIGVTRFPNDAARRYSLEPDYSVWKNKLRIFLPLLPFFLRWLLLPFFRLSFFLFFFLTWNRPLWGGFTAFAERQRIHWACFEELYENWYLKYFATNFKQRSYRGKWEGERIYILF